MNKEKVKALEQKGRDDQEVREAEATVEKLREIGLARGEDYDGKSASEVLAQLQEADLEEEVMQFSPIAEVRETTRDGKIKYQMSDKSHAIQLLRAYQRRYGGEIKPRYALVSRLTGIPEKTLHGWWGNRKNIQETENTFLSESWRVIRLNLHEQLLRLVMGMRDIDYGKGEIKEVGILLDKIIQNLRLLEDKSTKNVEKHEKVEFQITPPDAAIAGIEPGGKHTKE